MSLNNQIKPEHIVSKPAQVKDERPVKIYFISCVLSLQGLGVGHMIRRLTPVQIQIMQGRV